jgi:hypothetical protein
MTARERKALNRSLLAMARAYRDGKFGDATFLGWEFMHVFCEPWPCACEGDVICASIAESMALDGTPVRETTRKHKP